MAPVRVRTSANRPRIGRARRRSPQPPGHKGRRSLIRFGRRALLALLATPPALRVVIVLMLMLVGWSALNWAYQVIRQPGELFFPIRGTLSKRPPDTWRAQ